MGSVLFGDDGACNSIHCARNEHMKVKTEWFQMRWYHSQNPIES
jgi:hypothetical protein